MLKVANGIFVKEAVRRSTLAEMILRGTEGKMRKLVSTSGDDLVRNMTKLTGRSEKALARASSHKLPSLLDPAQLQMLPNQLMKANLKPSFKAIA